MKKSVLPVLGAAALLGGASLAYAQTPLYGPLTQPGPWGHSGPNVPGQDPGFGPTGRIGPTVEPQAATSFAGERDEQGRLMPTYLPQQAQATPPSPYEQPGTQPPMQQRPAHQQPTQQEIREREAQRQMQTEDRSTQPEQRSGQAGTMGMTRHAMPNPPHATALLNKLSAEGYRPTGNFERVGNAWQVHAVRQDGRTVTVQVDPQTRAIRETR